MISAQRLFALHELSAHRGVWALIVVRAAADLAELIGAAADGAELLVPRTWVLGSGSGLDVGRTRSGRSWRQGGRAVQGWSSRPDGGRYDRLGDADHSVYSVFGAEAHPVCQLTIPE